MLSPHLSQSKRVEALKRARAGDSVALDRKREQLNIPRALPYLDSRRNATIENNGSVTPRGSNPPGGPDRFGKRGSFSKGPLKVKKSNLAIYGKVLTEDICPALDRKFKDDEQGQKMKRQLLGIAKKLAQASKEGVFHNSILTMDCFATMRHIDKHHNESLERHLNSKLAPRECSHLIVNDSDSDEDSADSDLDPDHQLALLTEGDEKADMMGGMPSKNYDHANFSHEPSVDDLFTLLADGKTGDHIERNTSLMEHGIDDLLKNLLNE